MIPAITVIACTYNPREEIFKRCLNAVAEASKILTPAQILIIDNNSLVPVASLEYVQNFLKNEATATVIVEKEQGLTPARLRGIKESTGGLLIFIDDDNVVENSFFQSAAEIAEKYKMIGAFSGQVLLDFEISPPSWSKRYWGLLVYREFNTDVWSNLPDLFQTMPCGAGLCVKKEVADYYLQLHLEGKRPIQLDRTGKSFFSGGDNDLSACACDIGLGMGLFHSLKLLHIIPPQRVEKQYLLNLTRGIAASSIVFRAYRGALPQNEKFKTKLANCIRYLTKSPLDRAFFTATIKGEKEGKLIVTSQRNENNSHR